MDIWVGYIQTSSFADIMSNFHVWFCDLHWSINGAFCFIVDWGDIIAGEKRLGHYYFKLSKFPFRRLFNLLVISSGRKFVAEIVKGEQPSQEHLFCFIYKLVISKNWACINSYPSTSFLPTQGIVIVKSYMLCCRSPFTLELAAPTHFWHS